MMRKVILFAVIGALVGGWTPQAEAEGLDTPVLVTVQITEPRDTWLDPENIAQMPPMPVPEVDPVVSESDPVPVPPGIPPDRLRTDAYIPSPVGIVHKVEERSRFPHSAIGALQGKIGWFPTSGFHCSAAYDYKLNIIITSAHCVVEPDGTPHNDLYFVRGYEGNRLFPVGYQTVFLTKVYYPKGYLNKPDHNARIPFDIAVSCPEEASTGGALGFSPSAGGLTHPVIVGYPERFFDGQSMSQVQGDPMRAFGLVKSGALEFATAYSSSVPFNQGSSGGPWLWSQGRGFYGTTIGVTSAVNTQGRPILYSPLISSGLLSFLNKAVAACEAD